MFDENKRFHRPSRSQSLFEQVDFRSSLEVADPLCRPVIHRRMGQHYSVQSQLAELKDCTLRQDRHPPRCALFSVLRPLPADLFYFLISTSYFSSCTDSITLSISSPCN